MRIADRWGDLLCRHARMRLHVALHSSAEEQMSGTAALKQLFLPDSLSNNIVQLDTTVSLTLGPVSLMD